MNADASENVEDAELGVLPVWNLADLYASFDSPALNSDLQACRAEAKTFRER